MRKFILTVTTWIAMVGFINLAHAKAHEDVGVSRSDLAKTISDNTDLSPAQVNGLIALLEQQFQVTPGNKIPISGYLYARGINAGFIIDNDTWHMNATIVDPQTGKLVNIPKLFLCDFYNGGLKLELAYKWMFTFMPSGMTVDSLDGAVFGRGLGVAVAPTFAGIEGSWMPGQNRQGSLYHVAVKIGYGEGLMFPKMKFHLRKITGGAVNPVQSAL